MAGECILLLCSWTLSVTLKSWTSTTPSRPCLTGTFLLATLLGFSAFEISLRPSQLHRKMMLKEQLGFYRSGRGLENVSGFSCFLFFPCWFAQFLTDSPHFWLRSHHFDTSVLHNPSRVFFHISTKELVAGQVLQRWASLSVGGVSCWFRHRGRESPLPLMDDQLMATSRWALCAITVLAYVVFDAADLLERFGRVGRSRPVQNAFFHFSLASLGLFVRNFLYLLTQ